MIPKNAGLPSPVLVAAHVSRIYGPVQALAGYLKAAKADFTLVSLPFGFSGIPRASAERYSAGRLSAAEEGHPARGFEPLLWARDFFFVLGAGWRGSRQRPYQLGVGVDALNAAALVLLRRLGRVEQVAFYVIDYTPRRFGNPVLNWAYHAFDRFAACNADVVWNLSVRMQEVRRAQGVAEARNQVVPVGVDLDTVRPAPAAKVKRHTLLYMGALMDNKGLQLLVDAFPEVLKAVPKAELHIMGYGPFEAELRRLADASPARSRIKLHGGLPHAKLFKVVPTYGVALAPYLDDPGSYTWWCDPTKPKEYLACGLPLIITKVPWIWERVADRAQPLGLAIDYERQQLVAACVRLLKDGPYYRRCRANALRFAAGFSWRTIYDRAFAALPQAPKEA